MRKKILINLCLLAASLAFSLFAAECTVRHFGLSKTWESYIAGKVAMKNIDAGIDSTAGFKRKPNSSFFTRRNVPMKYNDFGFRDVTWGKKEKERIAFLGDSVTEGFGVDVSDRFSNMIMVSSRGSVETLNFGISGHATLDELVILQDEVLKFNPDRIILQVCINDFKRNKELFSSNLNGLSAEIQVRQEQKSWSLAVFLQKNSALYLFVAERYNYYRLKMGYLNAMVPDEHTIDPEEKKIFKDILLKVSRICQNSRIDFAVTYIPLAVEVIFPGKRSLLVNSLVFGVCKELNVPFINAIEKLKEFENPDRLFLDDCHLTKAGNSIVAEQIWNYCLKEGVSKSTR